jgi:hypothetical protein
VRARGFVLRDGLCEIEALGRSRSLCYFRIDVASCASKADTGSIMI